MSKRLITIAVLLLTLPVFFSCHKETSATKSGGLNGDFRALVNGVDWIAADTSKSAYMLAGVINITGISVDNKQLSITLNDTVTGVYTLNASSTSFAAYADNSSSGLFAYSTNASMDTSKAGGIVTITSIDKVHRLISGTFSFKVYQGSVLDTTVLNITQGVFYNLSYSTSLPISSSSDTLNVVIDGTNWAAQSIVASGLTGQLMLSGATLNGLQSVSLIMPLNVAPGSYTLDYSNQTYIGAYIQAPSISLVSTNGTLTILSNDPTTHRINGNFQFLAADPAGINPSEELTNGYFSVIYTY